MARDSGRPHHLHFRHYLTPSQTLGYNSGYCSSGHNKHLCPSYYPFHLNLSLPFHHSFPFPSLPYYFFNLYLSFPFHCHFPSPSLIIPFPYLTFLFLLLLLLLIIILQFLPLTLPFLSQSSFSSFPIPFPSSQFQVYTTPFASLSFPLHSCFAAVLDLNSHYYFPSFPYLFIIKKALVVSNQCFSFSYIQLEKFFQKKFFYNRDYPHKVFPKLTPIFFTPT